jgi:hypothetical protein
VQVDAVPDDSSPIEPHQTHRYTLRLASAFDEGDAVRLGLSAAATAVAVWTSDALTKDSTGAATVKAPSAAVASSAIILNTDDAPVEIADVVVSRGPTGGPVMVHVTARNRLDESLVKVSVDALLFDTKGVLRFQAFGTAFRPILGHGTWSHDIVVSYLEADANWQLVIAVREANSVNKKWTHDHLREQATERLRQQK